MAQGEPDGLAMPAQAGCTPPNRAGFTLLELLVVVLTIVILSGFALPHYFRAVERSRASEALQLLASIRAAQLRHRVETGAYAAALDDLDIDVPGFHGNPATPNWAFTTGAIPGANAVATRGAGGPYAGETVEIDLDTAALCASDSVYGLNPTPC